MTEVSQQTKLSPKLVMIVNSLVKNCLVWTMVDEQQKLPPDEIGPKSLGVILGRFHETCAQNCMHHKVPAHVSICFRGVFLS